MWTEEQDAALVQLWQAGHSASVIAAKFEGKTRSAVIGRVHRLRAAGGKHLERSSYPTIHIAGGAHVQTGERKPRIRRTVTNTGRWSLDEQITPPEPVSLAGPQLRPLLAPVEPPIVVIRANEREPDGTPANLMELCSAACKWPVESNGSSHLFCNKLRRGGSSYCDEHTLESFAPLRGRSFDPAHRTAIDKSGTSAIKN